MTVTITNRGKYKLLTTGWTGMDIGVGLLGNMGGSVPAGVHDPDLDTVSGLLAISNVAEVNATNYVRKQASSLSIAEDDINDRVNLDLASITWSTLGGGANDTIRCVFFYAPYGSGTDSTRDLIGIWDIPATTTNGGDFVVNTPNDVIAGV